MKNRILAAIAIAIALPAAAQANSAVEQRHFDQQSESLNIQQTAQYHSLPSAYTVDVVSGGHSAAADQALHNVAESTRFATDVKAGDNELIGEGQSVAAAQALQHAGQAGSTGHGNVEMSFASR